MILFINMAPYEAWGLSYIFMFKICLNVDSFVLNFLFCLLEAANGRGWAQYAQYFYRKWLSLCKWISTYSSFLVWCAMCHLRERTSYLFDVANSVLFYRLKFVVHRVMAVYNFKQEIRSMARCVLFEKFSGASSAFFYLYAHSFIRKNNVDVKEWPIPSVQEKKYIYISR